MSATTKSKNNLPSGIKCCIKKCQKSKRHFKGLKMFKFPSPDMILGKIWREKCRIPETDFNKNLFICENHFSSSYVGKKKLKAGAIPTVHMDEESEDFDAESRYSPKKLDFENVEAPLCTNCAKQILLVDQYRTKYSNLLKKYQKIQEILKSKRPTKSVRKLNRRESIDALQNKSKEKKKLIAEIRKRPVLWDLQTKGNSRVLQQTWKQLGRAMGADVNDCKRKWTSLLLGYRLEVKRLELRIKEDKLKGSYNPKKEYRSKWMFYELMKFCDNIKNPSLMELGKTFVNDINSDDNDSNQVSKFQNNKMKEVCLPECSPQAPGSVKSNISEQNSSKNQEPADKPTTSHSKCTKRSYAQANCMDEVEKEKHSLIKSANVEPVPDLEPEVYIPDHEDDDTDSQMSGMEFLSEQNSPQNQKSADDKSSSTGVSLEDIEKDEHSFTKSAKVGETDSQISDSDYNFLVSFLPKMKKINELQKLQFRAKVAHLALDISTK
ncbi:uncharacterized protein LOC135954883 [Calliphora vicina]|uniref:uncharacterized protein LOC135954883 n=1 Tax=Calliphora vicina TaxID=7373 RepID=UPI00325B512D